MKANSPICVRQKPDWMAVFRGWFAKRRPHVPKMICPKMIARVMMMIGTMYCVMTAKSTIMPTDTKKMAPKVSFRGRTNRSILSASNVSARMEPMTKAPNAEENPTVFAKSTMPKHKPSEKTSKVSSFSTFFAFRRMIGMK